VPVWLSWHTNVTQLLGVLRPDLKPETVRELRPTPPIPTIMAMAKRIARLWTEALA